MKTNLLVKINVSMCVIMCIFSIYQTVIQKSLVYATCAVLWADLAIIQVMYELTIKSKDELIRCYRNYAKLKCLESAELRKIIENKEEK